MGIPDRDVSCLQWDFDRVCPFSLSPHQTDTYTRSGQRRCDLSGSLLLIKKPRPHRRQLKFSLQYHTILCGLTMFIGCLSSLPNALLLAALTLILIVLADTSYDDVGLASLQRSRRLCTVEFSDLTTSFTHMLVFCERVFE
jgi:hypothetical protein